MSTTPTPSNGYAIAPGQWATRQFFQAVFSSVHERLSTQEALTADYDDAIDRLTTQALASVTATIGQEIASQRQQLLDIQADALEVLASYEQINSAGGVPAGQIRVAAIGGFNPGDVQAAFSAYQSRLAALDATNVETAEAVATANGEISNRVRFDVPQALDATQRKRVRDSILAPSFRQARTRNRILDPALQVSQQNNLFSSSTNGWYPSDSWSKGTAGAVLNNNLGRVISYTPGGSPFRLRWTVGTVKESLAAGDYDVMTSWIEDTEVSDYRWGTVDAKRLTVKFGVKGPAGTWAMRVANELNNRCYLTSFTIAPGEANTDVYKTIELPGDANGVWSNVGGSRGLGLSFSPVAGTTFVGVAGWQAGNFLAPMGCSNLAALAVGTTFEFFDFQVHLGLAAGEEPPLFEVPDYAATLAKCERYYETGVANMIYNASGAGAQIAVSLPFRQKKRTASVSVNTVAGTVFNQNNYSSGGYDTLYADGARFYMSASAAGPASISFQWFANARM